MIPKKVKKSINPYPGPELTGRRKELASYISKYGTYLPKSILHADLDSGMLDFVKENFQISVEGKKVPVIGKIITSQRWAEYLTTWEFTDDNKNIQPPFISVIRHNDVKFGSNPSLIYTIPNRKTFTYSIEPTFDGTRKGANIYKIPQPVPVDITYDVIFVANRMREINLFNKEILQKFSSRQAYTFVKGHYIPIINQEITDESEKDLEKRRYYLEKYTFLMQGFLIDEEEFEVKPAVSRALMFFEVDSKKTKSTKPPKQIENIDEVIIKVDLPQTATTYTFEYNVDLDFKTKNNINSYTLSINSKPTQLPILIKKDDVLGITVVKDDHTKDGFIEFTGKIHI